MGLLSWFERFKNGSVMYYKVGYGNPIWNDLNDKIDVATNNPVLLPAIQMIAEYFSSAIFYENVNGEKVLDTPLIKLLKAPNPLQNGDDFLKQFIWFKYACGFDYVFPVTTNGNLTDINKVKYFYNLRPDKIEFNKYAEERNFESTILMTESEVRKYMNQILYYDRESRFNNSKEIPFKQVLPFYDLANGLGDNMATSPSRLDSIRMPLSNIKKVFEAKNIVIQSNGKELIINETVGNIAKIPMKDAEKQDIEDRLSNYGVGQGQKRTIVTNAALKHQSLHIPLGDLGLDESFVSDATTILNTIGIPPTLLSFDGKALTFDNKEKDIVHFVQSKIQSELNDFTDTFNDRYGTSLVASLDHLPIFSTIEKQRIASLRSFAFGLKILVDAQIHTPQEARVIYDEYIDKV